MFGVFRRLRARVRYRSFDRDLNLELQEHRRMAEEALRAEGTDEREARHQAARLLGNAALAREDSRHVWLARWVETVWQDVRTSTRMLRKSPGFSSAAILSLAIGIGANSAVFTLTNGLLLKPVPYGDPDRLVMVWAVPPKRPDVKMPLTAREYLAWGQASVFESVATEQQFTRDVGADEHTPAETVAAQNITASMFNVLGVQPAIGRPFGIADEGPEGFGPTSPVVLISDALWQRRYNRDPKVVGRPIRVDGVPLTILGVMPPRFGFWDMRRVDVWGPGSFARSQLQGGFRGQIMAAKLKAGVNVAQAQAELDVLAPRLWDSLPEQSKGFTAKVESMHQSLYGQITASVVTLQSAVSVVLLIACANVAGLLLARALSRSTEIAVRSAIGASRARIIRQLLTESVVLAGLGGVAGIGLAWILHKGLAAAAPVWLPRVQEISIDAGVVIFTLSASLVTGLLFGMAPAIALSKTDLLDTLKTAPAGTGVRPATLRLRGILVVVETALAVLLLAGAGLRINDFRRLTAPDEGVDMRDVLAFTIEFSGATYQKTVGSYQNQTQLLEISPVPAQVYSRLWEGLHVIPGVKAAGAITSLPLMGSGRWMEVAVDGTAPAFTDEERQARIVSSEVVTPGLFETLNIPLMRGRTFDARDTGAGPPTIVINEVMAKQFWPNVDPIGHHVRWLNVADETPRAVIGVTKAYKVSVYSEDLAPQMYSLSNQQPSQTVAPFGAGRRRMTFLVKADARQSAAIVPAIRQTMTQIDKDKAITEIRPMDEVLGEFVARPRYSMLLLTVLATAAVVLTAVGIYGVVAHTVTRRTREIGIRMALGATRPQALSPVLRHASILVLAGLTLGIAAAVLMARGLETVFERTSATDAAAYAGVSLVMLVVGVAAISIPAVRAARITPTAALKLD